jgi:hypothetical protein
MDECWLYTKWNKSEPSGDGNYLLIYNAKASGNPYTGTNWSHGSWNDIKNDPDYVNTESIGLMLESDFSNSSIVASATKVTGITKTNAVVYGRIDKPFGTVITQIGCNVWEAGTNNIFTFSQKPSRSYASSTNCFPYFNLNKELGLTLKSKKEYRYQIFAMVNNILYASSEGAFITN